jgi:hypothetical protein
VGLLQQSGDHLRHLRRRWGPWPSAPPEDILGLDFDGYLVVDGLKGYVALEVAKGRCNDHLLRRCKDSHEVVSAKEQPSLESLSTLLQEAIEA